MSKGHPTKMQQMIAVLHDMAEGHSIEEICKANGKTVIHCNYKPVRWYILDELCRCDFIEDTGMFHRGGAAQDEPDEVTRYAITNDGLEMISAHCVGCGRNMGVSSEANDLCTDCQIGMFL